MDGKYEDKKKSSKQSLFNFIKILLKLIKIFHRANSKTLNAF